MKLSRDHRAVAAISAPLLAFQILALALLSYK